MTNLNTFNFKSNDIRVVEIDGEPWFLASEVCKVLGYNHTPSAVRDNTTDDQRNTVRLTHGIRGNPNRLVVSEGGLYSLIMGSRLPKAVEFKAWVTGTVLPAIRKDGAYIMGEEKVATGEMSEDELLLKAMQILNNKVERLTAERDTEWRYKTSPVRHFT